MKKNRLIRNLTIIASIIIGSSYVSAFAQVDSGTGMEWSEPSTSLILNENFQDFDHFYSKPNSNSGTSAGTMNPELEPDDPNYITLGYKSMTIQKKLVGNPNSVPFDFYQCAFAPEWMTAYAFRDEDNEAGTGANTPNVSNGFVEISRDWPTDFNIPGYLEIDLSIIPYIELIQYTHSSTGGNKRGFLLEFSLDGGANWDTLRFQAGNPLIGFTKDIIDLSQVEHNQINCQPSGYGMTWEEPLYFTPEEEYDDNLRIRFSPAMNQGLRIHDIRIYGEFPTSIKNINNELGLKFFNNTVTLNEFADINIYSITGIIVKQATNTTSMSTEELSTGVYIVNAKTGNKSSIMKIKK